MTADPLARTPSAVIGIVGGLGPRAHLHLERCLLAAAFELVGGEVEQRLPQWILCSIPATPDRVRALLDGGPDPAPAIIRAVRAMRGEGDRLNADFAVIACCTAHAFLERVRAAVDLELLDMVQACAQTIAAGTPGARVGILATSGTLSSRLFHDALARAGLSPVSLLDLPGGEALHHRLITATICGETHGETRLPGIKQAGALPAHLEAIAEARGLLVDKLGATSIVLGCTELSLALDGVGAPYVDPIQIVARLAVRRAYALD